jgi:hypothetical protein
MPAVPLVLHSTRGPAFRVTALVDSGADASCFPLGWARPLGVDLNQCEPTPAMTAGGTAVQYHWRPGIDATVDNRRLRLRVVFAPLDICLVGRDDFFAQFVATFDQRRRILTLEPYRA